MFEFLKRLKKSESGQVKRLPHGELTVKYNHFRELLSANNTALELIADLEDKLSGEYLFDKTYLLTSAQRLSESILRIIENINALSGNAYNELFQRHKLIEGEINKILFGELVIPVSPYTKPIEGLSGSSLLVAGGKMSHLGEIKSVIGCPVPEGFVVTTYAFKKFIEHNKIGERLIEMLQMLPIDRLDELRRGSEAIRDIIMSADVPIDIGKAISEAIVEITSKVEARESAGKEPSTNIHQTKMKFAVRSSAVFEDGDFSFAGQYATFLNVSPYHVIQKYKEVIASLFTPNAVFYHKTKDFTPSDMVMSVGVLEMINAKCGGVIYSRDPNNPDKDVLLINAAHGLGKAVVDGTHEIQSYTYSRAQSRVVESRIGNQRTMLVSSINDDILEIDVPEHLADKPCLTEQDIERLVNEACKLEDYYKTPQDIEWAIDYRDNLFLLQTRPLKLNYYASEIKPLPKIIEGYNLLIDRGVIASKGVGYGKAYVLTGDDQIDDFPEGAVLVARHTSTKFAVLMKKVSAIVTDIGGATGHMASIAREYNIPTIVDTEKATKLIGRGDEITVDAINCNVYAGRVVELIEASEKEQDTTLKKTRIFKTLQDILRWISPLNLTDPEADNFKPSSCNTYHDITRFAHEMSMRTMFETGLNYEHEDTGTASLKASLPTEILILDLGGGIANTNLKVNPEEVLSVPFKAMLSGMLKMRWPDPPRTDAKGFLGMIARTATISEEQLTEAAKKSFAIVSGNYLNFSIRLGYHFSLVESFVGDNINDNYIRFFFKGGGAAIDRRLRRVGMIARILRKMDFNVVVTNDVINALITDFKGPYIEDRLEIMGKLTAYTKQLDMTLYNDAIADMFAEQFIKEHMKQYM